MIVAIFPYLSIETITVAASEVTDPEAAVKKAFKVIVFRLFLLCIVTLSLILIIAPVSEIF